MRAEAGSASVTGARLRKPRHASLEYQDMRAPLIGLRSRLGGAGTMAHRLLFFRLGCSQDRAPAVPTARLSILPWRGRALA